MVPAFKASFAKVKAAGLNVIVTTSHSAPYDCDTPETAIALVVAWVQDDNIDILSPQLYTTGLETSPSFEHTSECDAAGCTWALYENSKAAFVPSIVDPTHYSVSQLYFSVHHHIELGGYI